MSAAPRNSGGNGSAATAACGPATKAAAKHMINRKRIFSPQKDQAPSSPHPRTTLSRSTTKSDRNSRQFMATDDKPATAVNLRDFMDVSQLIGMNP
jgi:hypothetical protein